MTAGFVYRRHPGRESGGNLAAESSLFPDDLTATDPVHVGYQDIAFMEQVKPAL